MVFFFFSPQLYHENSDRAVNLCCVRVAEGQMVKEPIRVVPELTEIIVKMELLEPEI